MKIYKIKVNGKTYKVELEAVEEVKSDAPATVKAEAPKAAPAAAPVASGDGNAVLSPIQGRIVDIKVKVGDKVKKGQTILVIEAMKLENEVGSTFDGVVSEILVSKGQDVSNKQPLVNIK